MAGGNLGGEYMDYGGGGGGIGTIDPGMLGHYGLAYGQGNPASWGFPVPAQAASVAQAAPAQPALDPAEQARLQQQAVIQALQDQAAGAYNTRAQHELQANNQLGQQSQYALASTQHGTGAGAQMRQAQMGASQVAQQLPGQQEIQRLQGQDAAQALLAQMLQQQGQNDASYGQYGLDALGTNLGFGLQDTNFFNRYLQMGVQGAGSLFGTGMSVFGGGGSSDPNHVNGLKDNPYP